MKIQELLKLWRVEKGESQLAGMPENFYEEALALTDGSNPYEAKKAKDIYADIVHMRQHKLLMACLRQLHGGEGPENLLAVERESYERIYAELEGMMKGRVKKLSPRPKEEEGPEETLPSAGEKAESEIKMGAAEAGEGSKEAEESENAGTSEASASEPEEEKLAGPAETIKDDSKEKNVPAGEKEKGASGEEEAVFKGETEKIAAKRVRFLKAMPAFVGPDLETIGPFEEGDEIEIGDDVAEILLKNDAVELI